MADVNLACKPTQVVTFNMHGFNQGAALLLELYLSADVIFCQEHWLLTSQLYQLDDFHCSLSQCQRWKTIVVKVFCVVVLWELGYVYS